MCAMHILYKTGTVSLRVAETHLIFDHICVCTIQTNMRRLLTSDLSLAVKKLLSIYNILFPPPLLSGDEM